MNKYGDCHQYGKNWDEIDSQVMDLKKWKMTYKAEETTVVPLLSVKNIIQGLWDDSSSYEDFKRSVFAWINHEVKKDE